MTSGNVQSVLVSSIRVGDRQRKTLRDIENLAHSLSTDGQMNPIVITPDHELVAGERRLRAAEFLGWSHILAHFTTDLPQSQLHKLELEENVRRLDLDWKDKCLAIAEYHEIMMTDQPDDWNQERTAEALNASPNYIANNLAVARALRNGVKLVVNADKYSVARGIVERSAERARANQLAEINDVLEEGSGNLEQQPVVTVLSDEPDQSTTHETDDRPDLHAKDEGRLACVDFHDWLRVGNIKRGFNFIHCDFPYGIDADKHDGTAGDKFGGYEDSKDVYFALLEEFCSAIDYICAPSAHIMFWFSMDRYYHETYNALTRAGLTVARRPLIWYRLDNSGILPDAKRGPRWNYETAFLCTRGDRPIVQAVSDCSAVPNKKSGIHMSEKPQPMLNHFFRMFIDEHSHVFDPTAGSANALRVAERMGAASVFGLEKDPTYHALALEKWNEETNAT